MQAAVQAQLQQARNMPNDFDAQFKAGELFYQIQRYDDALEFWQKANKLRQTITKQLSNLAMPIMMRDVIRLRSAGTLRRS
jgi:tetratricopeptide (TPR) repeat protein